MFLPVALVLIVIISSIMLWRQFSTHALANDAPDEGTVLDEAPADIAKAA
jgi:hypothetical protein